MAKYSPGVDCFSVITNGGLWVSGPDLAHLYQAVPLAYLGKPKLDSKPGPSAVSSLATSAPSTIQRALF